ncbi:hypothetical protein MHM86_12650 [Thalassobius sp. Cn5-15]|nr:hypothetical protein [Thalassobius sp. Cn5-15]
MRTLSLIVVLSLTSALIPHAHAETLTAHITLDTASRAIMVESDSPGVPTVEWLAAEGAGFSGLVPELQSPTRINGWSETASYLTGGGWLPKASDADAADADQIHQHDITVTVPASDRVAVTGHILHDRVTGDQREVRFAFEGPSSDLGIFVGSYEVGQGDHALVALRTYLQPEDHALSAQYLEASARYIDRFSAEIGDFPYSEFSVVSAPIPVGLGFAGATYIGQSILPRSYMTGRSLAHEVLHNWWGNAVRVDYASGNWSEGLTTFMADYGLAEDDGALAGQQMRMDWLRKLALIEADQMKPLASFISASHDRGEQGEGYGKAAMVFHMLRSELGHTQFYDGLRQFYRSNNGREAGWADLQQAFEQVSERDLSQFFAQWINRAGLPRLQLLAAAPTGADQLTLTLAQDADAAPYDLLVPVLVETSDGPEHHSLRLTKAEQQYDLTLNAPALSVHVDPAFDLARWPATQELSPTLDNAFAASGFNAALAAPEAADAAKARALLEEMLNVDLVWGAEAPHPVDLIFGTTQDVADHYVVETGHAFPYATDGAARAWLERGEGEQLRLYISADDLEDAAAQMRFLGYYGSKSYVSFENASGHTFGVLPSDKSALRVVFE